MSKDDDVELNRIRQNKTREIMNARGGDASPETQMSMPNTPIEVTDTDFDEFIEKYPLLVVDC